MEATTQSTPPEQQKPSKPKAKRVPVSPMRKLTSQLDAEVRKVEEEKNKLAALQKSIAEGESRIQSMLLELNTLTTCGNRGEASNGSPL
jgi:hypothetical protein